VRWEETYGSFRSPEVGGGGVGAVKSIGYGKGSHCALSCAGGGLAWGPGRYLWCRSAKKIVIGTPAREETIVGNKGRISAAAETKMPSGHYKTTVGGQNSRGGPILRGETETKIRPTRSG